MARFITDQRLWSVVALSSALFLAREPLIEALPAAKVQPAAPKSSISAQVPSQTTTTGASSPIRRDNAFSLPKHDVDPGIDKTITGAIPQATASKVSGKPVEGGKVPASVPHSDITGSVPDAPKKNEPPLAANDLLNIAQVQVRESADLVGRIANRAKGDLKLLSVRTVEKLQVSFRLIGEGDEAYRRQLIPIRESAPPPAPVASPPYGLKSVALEQQEIPTGNLTKLPEPVSAGIPAWKPYELSLALVTLLGSLGMIWLSARKDRREARETMTRLRETELKNEELEFRLGQIRVVHGARSG